MALTICPDCGREISTRAAVCVHCGCPLDEDTQAQPCALLLLAPDPNDPQMTQRLQAVAGLTPEETDALRAKLPAVLKRGLPYRECAALTEGFTPQTQLSIVPDSDADDPHRRSKALPLQREAFHPPKPLGFWSIVGAILTALALWGLIGIIIGFGFI